MSNSKSYNVYNSYDPQFINYAELYKTPNEMKENTKVLINDYADALIKGDSIVYKNNPDLVGNRYFIDTKTKCLDKSDESIQTRSVLVDNVNETAMKTTKNGNTGLMYSLLASLKLMNSEKMFDGNKDDEPTPYIKDLSLDYLEDVTQQTLPICKKVNVYTSDTKDEETHGWVLENDYENIDNSAIVEGFKEGMGTADIHSTVMNQNDAAEGNISIQRAAEASIDTANAYNDFAEVNAEVMSNNLNDATATASAIAGQGQGAGADSVQMQNDYTSDSQKSLTESGSKAFNEAKKKGLKNALRKETKIFLDENEQLSTMELLKMLINTYYPCDEDESEVRIPGKCIEAIFTDVSNEKSSSKDAQRSNLCNPNVNFDDISFSSFIEKLLSDLNRNKGNKNELNITGLPNPEICVYVEEEKKGIKSWFSKKVKVRKQVDSYDYQEYKNIIDNYREKIAQEIVRYRNVEFFGHCPVIEGFSFTNEYKLNFFDMTAYFYIICLLFIFVFIIYRFMYRFFNFNKFIKKNSKKFTM